MSINVKINNPILYTDSYKASQYRMGFDDDFDEDGQKEKLVNVYAFIEARTGGKHNEIVVAGCHDVANMLSRINVTKEHVDEAEKFYADHFGNKNVFDRRPWDVVVNKYCGWIPIEFYGIPDGTIVPVGTPICTLESTDEECAQLVSHFEGLIQKAIWYPTTVATTSLDFSKAISKALDETTTQEVKEAWLPFAHQDFGYRGAASEESAILGGVAHLYISCGSDTVTAVNGANSNFTGMSGFSVPASEHNQMMSKGRDGEFKIVKRLLKKYPEGNLSVVADTYDLMNFVHQVSSGEIREMVMNRNGTLVIRPDSLLKNDDESYMTPAETISQVFKVLGNNLADVITINPKGYMVLDKHYKIIYGDGLNVQKVRDILQRMKEDGWSAENIVFGTGGNLLQKGIDRDTDRFAMKASEQTFEIETLDGKKFREVRNTAKETPGKESKKGRFRVVKREDKILTLRADESDEENLLVRMSCNGNICCPLDGLQQIRERVNEHRHKMGY